MFLDHTQRRSTVGRTPLDELITRPEESYRLCCVVVCDLETSRMVAPYIYDISHLRVKSRLMSGNACHQSVQNLLSSSLLSKNVKVVIYRTIILPVVLCGF